MAKCVRKDADTEVKRVSDEEAAIMVKEQGWYYCSKSTWKQWRKEHQ